MGTTSPQGEEGKILCDGTKILVCLRLPVPGELSWLSILTEVSSVTGGNMSATGLTIQRCKMAYTTSGTRHALPRTTWPPPTDDTNAT